VNYYRNRKTGGEKQLVFLHLFYFRDLLDSPFYIYRSIPFVYQSNLKIYRSIYQYIGQLVT
ncbi:hypothetical protein ACIQXQ_05435, partial [Peribacillus sp. NPDC097198]|uniref:hypothetical protein n=1 Tax=Peribacillus sp. NPDC097198 TaxID=3364397 RepID=UPI00380B664A